MIWERDRGTVELIEYFDQEDVRKGGWERLAAKTQELKVITQEIGRCRKDFSFFARNYAWITDKKRQDVPLKLWPSQELLLEKVIERKAQGKPQKFVILKGRQLGFCQAPYTRVLTADLKWVTLDEITPGTEIIAVDEHCPHNGKGTSRKMRTAVVIAKQELIAPAYRLTMDNGEVLVATSEHRYLCKKRGVTRPEWRTVGRCNSKNWSEGIRVGDEIRYITKPWKADEHRDDAWFGGLIDGEGSMDLHKTSGEVNVSQAFGLVFDKAKEYLLDRGYNYCLQVDTRKGGDKSKFGNKPVAKLIISRMNEAFRLLGQTRPIRFINQRWWEGKDLPGKKSGEAYSKVVAIEELPPQRMIDLQTTTKTFIAEGFVSHNSVLIEAMITHRIIFFQNVNAVIVSHAPHHSVYLFNILCHIYDFLPWWMKPMCLSRKIEEGLIFENDNHEDRAYRPGLKSLVVVQAANQLTGVGQGYRVSAAHCSELADWDDVAARQIIEGDLGNALADNPETFAFIETTAKGSGRYFHKLWNQCVDLGEEADWIATFFPAFMESTRVLPPPEGWRTEEPEQRLRERVRKEWLRCDNPLCRRYRESRYHQISLAGAQCPTCQAGILQSYEMSDPQLYWIQHKRKNANKDIESLKEYKQELCQTPEDAFQLSGIQVFPHEAFEWVQDTLEDPRAKGFFDSEGTFHGMDFETGLCPVPNCDVDHTYDDMSCLLWRYPEKDDNYVIGVDVAEGSGGDYSVAVVNKVSRGYGPDEMVAVFRSNMIDPISFSFPCVALGNWYNEAMLAIECNKYDTVFSWVRNQHQYTNLYRWKHIDSTNPNSNKWGWFTNMISKPRLYQTAIKFLKTRMWIVPSKNFMKEMSTFQKEDYEDRAVGHEYGSNDDEVMAAMISLYCAHDMDWDVTLNMIPIRKAPPGTNTSMWAMTCLRCNRAWGSNDPTGSYQCPQCFSMHVRGERNTRLNAGYQNEWEEMVREPEDQPANAVDYELM